MTRELVSLSILHSPREKSSSSVSLSVLVYLFFTLWLGPENKGSFTPTQGGYWLTVDPYIQISQEKGDPQI